MTELNFDITTELFGTDEKDEAGRSIQSTLREIRTGEPVTFIRDFDLSGKVIAINAYDSLGRKLGRLPDRVTAEAARFAEEHPDKELVGEVSLITGGYSTTPFGCSVHLFAKQEIKGAFVPPPPPPPQNSSSPVWLIFLPFIAIFVIVVIIMVTVFGNVFSFMDEADDMRDDYSTAVSQQMGLIDDLDDDSSPSSLYFPPSSSVTASSTPSSATAPPSTPTVTKPKTPPFTKDDLSFSFKGEYDPAHDITFVKGTFKNNSKLPLLTLTVYGSADGATFFFIHNQAVPAGESTPELSTFTNGGGEKLAITEFVATLQDKNGDRVVVKYDYRLNKYEFF